MAPALSKKATALRRTKSAVREIMDYASPAYFEKVGIKQSDVRSFAGGWVNHEAPEALREAYLEIAKDKALFHKSGGYPPTLGDAGCKGAIARYEEHVYGMNGLDASQVAIGVNSTHLAYTLFQTLLDPGGTAVLLDPSYCNYPGQLMNSVNAKLLRYPVLNPESWEYDAGKKADDFHDFIVENKPKMVLLIAPDNPSSQVLPQKFVEGAREAVEEIGSFLVVDFAYKEMVFGEKYPEYFSWAPSENFMSIHSNSKWVRSLGRRLGWIEAPAEVIGAMDSLLASSILCPDMLHEMALTHFLNRAMDEGSLLPYIKDTNTRYQKAAARMGKAIDTHLGMPYLVPQGGLYTCMKVGMDGAKFVERMIKEAGVLFVPGWGFGRTTRNAVRISYGPLVNTPNLIDDGMAKAARCLGK